MAQTLASLRPVASHPRSYGGTVDLYGQPIVPNMDGSASTVDSVGVEIDGLEYLLPTVTPDGRHFTGPTSVDQAVAEFRRTGLHLGVFASPEASTDYGAQLHREYEAGKYRLRPAASHVRSK